MAIDGNILRNLTPPPIPVQGAEDVKAMYEGMLGLGTTANGGVEPAKGIAEAVAGVKTMPYDPEGAMKAISFPESFGLERKAAPPHTIGTLMETADTFLGTPYRWGGNTRKGIDCSGLVQQSYRSIGIDLPRTAQEQLKKGREVPLSEAQPGDLIGVAGNGRGGWHIKMVRSVDNGVIKTIESSSSNGVVIKAVDPDKVKTVRRILPETA